MSEFADAYAKAITTYEPSYPQFTNTVGSDGYSAASWSMPNFTIEVQLTPESFTIYLSPVNRYRAYRERWVTQNAQEIGQLVCAGRMPPTKLADWCEANEPTRRDNSPGEFEGLADWLRKVK
jgi:hypothetical protein